MGIFERFPYLRDLIGNHGGPIKKSRPLTKRAATLFSHGDVDAWMIVDVHDGWERRLIKVDVDLMARSSIGLGFYGRRLDIDFKPVTGVAFDYWMLGLVFVEDSTNSLFVNEFEQAPEKARYQDKVSIHYRLQFEKDFFESYVPTEDLEFCEDAI